MGKTAVGVLATFLLASVANATVVLTAGNNPQPNEENVLLNTGTSGSTVQGTLNSTDQFFVNFSSMTQTLTEPANGQARIEASTGNLTDVAISLTNNYTYGDIIFNLHENGNPGDNSLTITVVSSEPGGAPNNTQTFSGLTLGPGENFYTLVATGGEAIISTSLSDTVGATDLRQVRLSPPFVQNNPQDVPGGVPEPGSYLMLAGGLMGLGMLRRRKK